MGGNVGLAVTEATTNVVRHAYPEQDGDIHLYARVDGDCLVVAVSDDGVGFTYPTANPSSGFGLQLMGELADTEIRSQAGHTRVEMRFPITQDTAADGSLAALSAPTTPVAAPPPALTVGAVSSDRGK
jgi:two-component sensor histidine kinase